MGMFDDDIVRDILRRAVAAAQRDGQFNDALAAKVEREARAHWGGLEHYVCKRGGASRIAERNDKIRDLYEAGELDVQGLSLRFGLSTKQVRRILDR